MILGNSYDPNDKSVSHPPMINPDEDEELTEEESAEEPKEKKSRKKKETVE